MKLKIFNRLNSQEARKGSPACGINFKTGIFRLTKNAVELTNLKAGDQVNICQDEDAPENWYIVKVKQDGFPLREMSGNDTGCLMFNNTTVARAIAASVEYEGKSGRCLLAGEATKIEKQLYWGLLINTLKNK